MSKIVPLITALPFYALPNNWVGPNSTVQDPFYFQKEQCLRDCFFGTITDRKHLPSFIIRVEKDEINYSTDINWVTQCPDLSDPQPIVPVYRWEVKGFINSVADRILVEAIPPTIGDMYYYDVGFGDVEIYTWNGAGWNSGGQIGIAENDLLNVINDGFVYGWSPNDGTDPNPARNGVWEKTNNGFQLCDIGDYTYVIYNGFEVESNGAPLGCGLRQIKVSFPIVYNLVTDPFWLSELVDIRDFNSINNEYHKLTIKNSCNLGNIAYSDVRFSQIYYFDKTTLVGEPSYKTQDTKEEDGLGDEKLIFSRLSKVHILDTLETPEYIVDFLMFATQHDIIGITFPYEFSNLVSNNNSANIYSGNREIDNDSFNVSSDWIETGCFSQVTLEFSLVDDVVKTACCQELDKIPCIECGDEIILVACYNEQNLIESGPPSLGDTILIKPVGDPSCDICDDPIICESTYSWYAHPNELATWNGSDWDYEVPEQDRCITVIENGDSDQMFFTQDGWQLVNDIIKLGPIEPYSITIKGYIFLTSSAYVYYRVCGSFEWLFSEIVSSQDLYSGFSITPLFPCACYEVKVLSVSNNCDYGDGPIRQFNTDTDGTC